MPNPLRDEAVELPLSGTEEFVWYLEKRNSKDVYESLSGETVKVHLAATKELSTDGKLGDIEIDLTERDDASGVYAGIMTQEQKATALAGKTNMDVYEIVVVSGIARDYQTRHVVDI